MNHDSTGAFSPEMLMPLVFALMPMLLLALVFAIPNYFLAKKVGRSGPLWAVMTCIPAVNYLFFIYVMYVVLFYVLDRLNGLAPAAPAPVRR